MADWHIEPCSLARVLPLRAAYSYEGTVAPDGCVQELDAQPSHHWVAVSDAGEDIGMITLSRASRVVCGERTDWRLRLVGVDQAWRKQGVATGLLRTGAAKVGDLGERAFWGSVRTALLPWYESMGAIADSVEYDLPPIGPHRNVLCQLDALHLD